ncbi:MAG: glucuronate isomerase [Anaerolineales bacterium]|nr:glucuronate isomerase [Anaerolineales bacterium]
MKSEGKHLPEDRFFDPDPAVRSVASDLYQEAACAPIVSPHGHVDPRLFSDPNATFGSPADLFIIPDHYVFRMLYSQGVALESLGVPRQDGDSVEQDHRKIWRTFCEYFHLFRGTPSGIWLTDELAAVFGITEKPGASNADRLFDLIAEKLASPDFSPRRLFERFNIEVLCTTDPATDTLGHHQAIRQSGWKGRILPTFRPDGVVNFDAPRGAWRANVDQLSEVSGIDVVDYKSFIRALEQRRAFFKSMGATATDHAALTPAAVELSPVEAEATFQRALRGDRNGADAARFTAHMLMEMARMSVEDGLVMQLHPGSFRNHNDIIFEKFGSDKGADIPVPTEYTRNLLPLLNKYGNDPRLTLILFTLDETTYSRELAPLAGHYPALKLGPPWWFFDSLNGIARYFDQVMETAGLYNTAGFNDDTRAFCSIPARHDVWRRASANWLGGLVARHIIDLPDARAMMQELTVALAKRAYHLD